MTTLNRTVNLPSQSASSTHFSFLAGPRIYGVLERPEQLVALQMTLHELGYDFQVLHGDSGVKSLDPQGRRGGLLTRLNRWLQGATEECGKIKQYVWALNAGHLVVAAKMPRDDARTKGELRQAFANARASQIDYFGHWLTEELSIQQEHHHDQ